MYSKTAENIQGFHINCICNFPQNFELFQWIDFCEKWKKNQNLSKLRRKLLFIELFTFNNTKKIILAGVIIWYFDFQYLRYLSDSQQTYASVSQGFYQTLTRFLPSSHQDLIKLSQDLSRFLQVSHHFLARVSPGSHQVLIRLSLGSCQVLNNFSSESRQSLASVQYLFKFSIFK